MKLFNIWRTAAAGLPPEKINAHPILAFTFDAAIAAHQKASADILDCRRRPDGSTSVPAPSTSSRMKSLGASQTTTHLGRVPAGQSGLARKRASSPTGVFCSVGHAIPELRYGSATTVEALTVGALNDDVAVPVFPINKARPADAVPSGRMGYDLSADRLLLHTIQTEEAFEGLLSTGALVPDPRRVELLHADAYGWLYRQMAARLPTTGDGAVWFWAQIRRQDLVELCKDRRYPRHVSRMPDDSGC